MYTGIEVMWLGKCVIASIKADNNGQRWKEYKNILLK